MRNLFLILIVLFIGCGDTFIMEISDPDTRTRARQEMFEEQSAAIANSLPSEAKNIKYLGNNWWQFDLMVDGFYHTFICRTFPRRQANEVDRFSAITEVGASNKKLE